MVLCTWSSILPCFWYSVRWATSTYDNPMTQHILKLFSIVMPTGTSLRFFVWASEKTKEGFNNGRIRKRSQTWALEECIFNSWGNCTRSFIWHSGIKFRNARQNVGNVHQDDTNHDNRQRARGFYILHIHCCRGYILDSQRSSIHVFNRMFRWQSA